MTVNMTFGSTLSLHPTDFCEIYKEYCNLKNFNSARPDDIATKFFSQCASQIYSCLSEVIN